MTLITSVLFLTLILSLLFPTIALADGETPPPPTEVPVVEVAPTEEPIVDLAPTEEPVVDAAPTESVAEAVQAMAEAGAVLVDENGQPIPLASQEAADALAAPDPQGCPAGVTPDWLGGTGTGCTTNYTSIQDAINDVSVVAGWTIYVQAGTYNESPNVNKSVTLYGNNAGVDPNTETRSAESIINGQITIAADNVFINGFTITNPLGKHGIVATDHSNISITNNIITDVGSSDSSTSGTNFGIAIVSSSAAVDDVEIRNNKIDGVQGGNKKSADGIAIGWSSGSQAITGLVIENNTITNITSDTSDYAGGGRGAYGILINHGTGTTGQTINAQVLNNTISNLEGLWVHGIGLEGNTPNALVQGNSISNLVDHKSPADPDAAAIMVEDNASADTVSIYSNSFANVLLGVRNATALTVNASGNWWGDADPSDNIYNPGGGGVDYTPWLNNGSDTSADPGFQGDFSVLNVDDDSPQTGATGRIQEGIDMVTGSTVNVLAGTYAGNITINKSVTLTGDPGDANAGPGPNAPVIDGGSTVGSAFFIANGVSDVTIQGFEMRNFINGAGNGEGNGISAWEASTSNITVQDNYFHNLGWNAVLVGNDGALGDHTGWTIANNVLENYDFYGFELTNASDSTIENNIIHASNSVSSILVVARRDESGITIRNNQIDGSIASGSDGRAAIYVLAWDQEIPSPNLDALLIEGNDISTTGDRPHIRIYDAGGTVTGVQVYGNSLSTLNNQTAGLVDASGNWWGTNDPADVAGSVFGDVDYTPWLNSGTDTSTDPGFQGDFSVLNVDDDSPQTDTIGRIQEAVDMVTGSTVNMMAGDYTEDVNINGKDGFTLQGAGGDPFLPNATIITGNVNADANTGTLTLQDFAVMLTPSDFGLKVIDHAGNVFVSNVTSVGHMAGTGYGGYFSGNTGTLTISDSIFSDNRAGLVVDDHNGDINLNNVTADGNGPASLGTQGAGAHITNSTGALTIQNSGFTGNEDGLVVFGHNGQVTLTDVNASDNSGEGAYIDNTNGTSDVLVDPSTFNNNGGTGLGVQSRGAITLQDVTAQGNDEGGAWLDNCLQDGTGACTNTADVTVTDSIFNESGHHGLDILTGGTLLLTNVTADSNGQAGDYGSGLSVCNYFDPDGAGPEDGYCQNTAASVTINGTTNVFNNNQYNGFEIYAAGQISLTNITANNNGQSANDPTCDPNTEWCSGSGAYLNTLGPVTVDPSTFNGNNSTGLALDVGGQITLTDITASGNGDSGAWLNNCLQDETGACTNTDDVSVTDSVFDDNGHHGLDVATGGTLLLTNVTADSNGQAGDYGSGLSVCNYFDPDGAGPEDGYCQNTAASVTINGTTNVFNNNQYNGLEIVAAGPISLTNITANNNVGGAWLDTSGAVTVSDSQFSNNPWGGFGAASPTGPVTLNNVVATGNGDDGIDIFTDGNVTLNSATITGNGYDGVYVEGYYNSTWPPNDWAGTVIVNGGTFTGNGDGTNPDAYGLRIYACQFSLDGAQTFGGNQTANVFFGQNPACVPAPSGDGDPKPIVPPLAPAAITAETVPLTLAELPGALPEDKTFVAGISVITVGSGQVSFDIPEDAVPPFTILFWDGTQWVEIPSTVVDGQVVFTVTQPGVYVLVAG